MRLLGFAAFVLVSVASHVARAAPDFAGDSPAWNGASTFVSLAREQARVLTPNRVRLDDLAAGDALFLLGPEAALPEDSLVDFVRRGGRLVIADDFGSGARLFARFGMTVSRPTTTEAPRVRGESALLVARPFFTHPLTEGVGVVVTNEPVLLEHPRLDPLVGLDEGGPGLVLTGIVGQGRVVAIGDPSLFVNAMMELRGNRKLAENIVRFVTEGTPPKRLVVALGAAPVTGRFDADDSGTLRERAERQLRALGANHMPDVGLRIAGALLATLAILLLASMREPRPEPARPWLASDASEATAEEASETELRSALERAVSRRLGLPVGASGRMIERALGTLGIRGAEGHRILRVLRGRGNEDTVARAARTFDAAIARRAGDHDPGRVAGTPEGRR